jgi:hypothetical protein
MTYRRQITRYMWNLWVGTIFFATDGERRMFFQGLQDLALALLEKVQQTDASTEAPPWSRPSRWRL